MLRWLFITEISNISRCRNYVWVTVYCTQSEKLGSRLSIAYLDCRSFYEYKPVWWINIALLKITDHYLSIFVTWQISRVGWMSDKQINERHYYHHYLSQLFGLNIRRRKTPTNCVMLKSIVHPKAIIQYPLLKENRYNMVRRSQNKTEKSVNSEATSDLSFSIPSSIRKELLKLNCFV